MKGWVVDGRYVRKYIQVAEFGGDYNPKCPSEKDYLLLVRGQPGTPEGNLAGNCLIVGRYLNPGHERQRGDVAEEVLFKAGASQVGRPFCLESFDVLGTDIFVLHFLRLYPGSWY